MTPNVYIIGDVQGCSGALRKLIAQIPNDAQIWFCGDLVNRGTNSLGVLRQIKALGKRAQVVLGNHDIHLLAVAAGARNLSKSDTIEDTLNSPDASKWLDWIRHQPLAHFEHGILMVHAGILPEWSLSNTLQYAQELEAILQADNYETHLKTLFGNMPNKWDDGLRGNERLRVITNTFTRMRTLDKKGGLNHQFKGQLTEVPNELTPWFCVPHRHATQPLIFFGHWSALGLHESNNTICLDTGCIWGGSLTAYHYPSGKILTAQE